MPRGRQLAIHGAVVNVPSDITSTVTVLPLTPAEAGLIPLKLKRRLRYKGYALQQSVRPSAVLCAVQWLIQHNPLYCGINIDHQWNQTCFDEDAETWIGITGNRMQDVHGCIELTTRVSECRSKDDEVVDALPPRKVEGVMTNSPCMVLNRVTVLQTCSGPTFSVQVICLVLHGQYVTADTNLLHSFGH